MTENNKNMQVFRMPLMGEGVHEATVVQWLKSVGDKVKSGEPLIQVSTDKVDTELSSSADGFLLYQCVGKETRVLVDQALAVLGPQNTAKQDIELFLKSVSSVHSNKEPETQKTAKSYSQKAEPVSDPGKTLASSSRGQRSEINLQKSEGGILTSPLVRKLAKDRGVDLSFVIGSGLNGRINVQDLEDYLQNPQSHLKHTLVSAGLSSSGGQENAKDILWVSQKLDVNKDDRGEEFLEGVKIRREAMSKIRQLTADHMIRSVATSPHVTTVFEVDMTECAKFLNQEKDKFAKENNGAKLSYTSLVLFAAKQAVKEHPYVNVSVDGYDVLWKEDINLGCAVAIPGGLIVPVIKKTQNMGLKELALKFHDVVNRARNKQLLAEEVKGGTFSLTNPGGYGSIHSNPIISQPQVAMLSMGAVVKRPVVVDGDRIEIRPIAMFGLTFDHRVIDGEGGAKYLASLKKYLETKQSF